ENLDEGSVGDRCRTARDGDGPAIHEDVAGGIAANDDVVVETVTEYGQDACGGGKRRRHRRQDALAERLQGRHEAAAPHLVWLRTRFSLQNSFQPGACHEKCLSEKKTNWTGAPNAGARDVDQESELAAPRRCAQNERAPPFRVVFAWSRPPPLRMKVCP